MRSSRRSVSVKRALPDHVIHEAAWRANRLVRAVTLWSWRTRCRTLERARRDELRNARMTQHGVIRLHLTYSHPDLDTTIVGPKSVEHLRDNVAAALKGPLPPDVVIEAKGRSGAIGAAPPA